MMSYVALILIIIGILLFMYSIFHRSIEDAGSDEHSGKLKSPLFSKSNNLLDQKQDNRFSEMRTPGELYTDDSNNYADEIDENRRGYSPNTTYNDEGVDPAFIKQRERVESDGSINYTDSRVTKSNKDSNYDNIESEFSGEERITREIAGEDNPESSVFVLFDDRSDLIDYQNNSGTIDTGLQEYKKIKRVGNGRFVLEREGISFYMGKKLFRFDFYRINAIHTGDNYIAIFMKGSDAVKLFIVEKETEIIYIVKEKFNEYISANV